jgi:hypothetical protein
VEADRAGGRHGWKDPQRGVQGIERTGHRERDLAHYIQYVPALHGYFLRWTHEFLSPQLRPITIMSPLSNLSQLSFSFGGISWVAGIPPSAAQFFNFVSLGKSQNSVRVIDF